MRRPLLAVSFAFSLFYLPFASAAQHAAGGGVAVAPSIHAVPMHVGPGPSGAPHAAYSHPGARPPSHTVARAGTSSAKSAVTSRTVARTIPTPRTAWHPVGLPPSSIAPIPSSLAYVNSVPTFLPGSAFFGSGRNNCLGGFNCFGGGRFRTSGVIIPWGGFGGFYVPIPYYGPDDEGGAPAEANAAPEQQTENNNEVAAEQPPAGPRPDYYAPAPSEPVYDFVFVKRDGTKVFAVAYSLTKDSVQYVTREGLRRTLPLDALDFDATQKSNEERGNKVNLPSLPPAVAS
jgi:hypothetical protein